MTDCFALLDVPRRPWLDAEALKEKFHRLGAEHHPDVAKSDAVDFAAINAAYNTLLDPKMRVKHLLDLEFPSADGGSQIPGEVTGLFDPVARGRNAATAFLKKRAALSTPLEIALLATEKLELIATMKNLETLLAQKQDCVLARLKSLDETWPQSKAGSADALLAIYQSLSYIGKWLEGISDFKFQVSN